MATTPEYISYDGNPTNPNGLTPFAIFDSESLFQTDGPKVANFVATRLGYPIMDVELQDLQIYACLEESIIEYGKQVNQFRIRDNMYSLLGTSTSDEFTHKNITATALDQIIRLSGDYGTEALSGGPVELKRGYFTASLDTASYDLNALWATPSESGNPIEIRKIYHHGAPAISRYYDPFAATGLGITNLFAEFGFDDYSPAITFVMMPAYEDMLRVQAIEINDTIRKSIHSFTISNNKLRISPIPKKSYAIFFDYYLKNEKTGSQVQSGSVNEFVSDASNVPMSHIRYANINSVGKVWIFKYTLALAKEVLGIIRSKYQSVPIPNQDIRMDGEILRREAVQEKQELIKELQETLEKSGLQAQMKAQAESAEHQNTILQKVPIPIYIK
jgi:hypothetical protein